MSFTLSLTAEMVVPRLYFIIAENDRGFEGLKPTRRKFDRRKACCEVVALKGFVVLYLRLEVH